MDEIEIKIDGHSYNGRGIEVSKVTNFNNYLFKELEYIDVIPSYDLKIDKFLYKTEKIEIELLVDNDEIAFIIERNYLREFLNFDFRYKFLCEMLMFKKNIDENKEIVSFINKSNKRNSISHNNEILEFTIFKSKIKMNTEDKYGLFYIPKLDGRNEPIIRTLNEIDNSFDREKKTAIIVHGLGSKVGKGYSGLFNYLSKDFNIFGFNYPSVSKSIADNSKELARYIKLLRKIIDKEIHIFAHSMGGLVSRSSLINDNAQIETIVMAGTPNGGVWYTEAHRARFLLSFLKNKKSFIPYEILQTKYKDAHGIKDLNQNSSFLISMNNNENISNCYGKYFALAGDYVFGVNDIIVPVNRVCSIKVKNNKMNIQSIVSGWHHFNYYSVSSSSLSDALDTARYCLNF